MLSFRMEQNLHKRLLRLSIDMTSFIRAHRKDICTYIILKQLYRSSTSIGANYAEAKSSESMKDFIHKVYICRKEAIESKYWLRLLISVESLPSNEGKKLLIEIHEIVLILSKIISKCRAKLRSTSCI